MNRADAAQVLAILSAPHGFTVEPDTMEVWYGTALERVDAELGTAVAVRLVETEERFPTPARFNSERARIERDRREAAERDVRAEQPSLGAPGMESDAEQRRRFIAEMRGHLTRMGENLKRHWHGGSEPCPVCSGIAPSVLAKMTAEQQQRIAMLQAAHRSERDRRHPLRVAP